MDDPNEFIEIWAEALVTIVAAVAFVIVLLWFAFQS